MRADSGATPWAAVAGEPASWYHARRTRTVGVGARVVSVCCGREPMAIPLARRAASFSGSGFAPGPEVGAVRPADRPVGGARVVSGPGVIVRGGRVDRVTGRPIQIRWAAARREEN